MYLKFSIHIFLASSSCGVSDTQGNILSILQEKQRKELGEMPQNNITNTIIILSLSWEIPDGKQVLNIYDNSHFYPMSPSLDFYSSLCVDTFIYSTGSQQWATLYPRGYLAIFRHFWLAYQGKGGLLVSSGRGQGCCQTLQCTGQPPTTKNYLPQNVSSVEVEKSWSCESGSKMVRKKRQEN